MKKQLITLSFLLLYCACLFSQKPAVVANDKTGWHKIGETTVDFGKDHDEVNVLVADRFAALKFKVTDAPIELLDIDVYFEEGDMQNVRVGFAMKTPGTESRVIDLKGGKERNLKKIVFRYKTLPNRQDKKANVEIWGKKTNPGKGVGNERKDGVKNNKDAGKDNKGHEGHDHPH
jgi:hypothetical protein